MNNKTDALGLPKNTDRTERVLRITAFILISFFGLLQVATAILLLLNIPVTGLHFPLTFAGALLFSFFFARERDDAGWSLKEFLAPAAVSLIILVISILIAAWFFDFSWDGQSYHQEYIIRLKNHWNPTQSYLPYTVPLAEVCNYYSRGIETIQSTLYAFTGCIETGKATGFILFFATLSLCYSFLIRQAGLSKPKAWILALITACNPVFLYQAFTYYIDAHIYFLYVILIVSAIRIFITGDNIPMILYGFAIILLLPAKFIAIPMTGILVIALIVILLLYRRYKLFVKVVAVSAVCSAIGFFLVGYQPYVTNLVNHSSPFYPFSGAGAAPGAPLVDQSPEGFPEKNRVAKFFISVFSRTENLQHAETNRTPGIKVPFTLNKKELRIVWDQRLGGFGPFYGGAFLVSVILLTALLFRLTPGDRRFLICLIIPLTASVFIISEPWWFRYVPQLWLFSVILIFFAEVKWKNRFSKVLSGIVYVALVLNIMLTLAGTLYWNVRDTLKVKEQLEIIQKSGKTVIADFGIFTGNEIRLQEQGIPYVRSEGPVTAPDSFSMLHSKVKMCYLP